MTNLEHLRVLSSIDTESCVLWDRGRAGEYGSAGGTTCHRQVCIWFHGPPPFPRAHAAHSCGTSLCVNPRHIRWATAAQNIADKVTHGRVLAGERHHQAKLTAEQVKAIRSEHLTAREAMTRFGIGRSQAYRILNRESWSAT